MTHARELLQLIHLNCKEFGFIKANFTAKGVEAIIRDNYDGQLYRLAIEGLVQPQKRMVFSESKN